MNVDEAANAAIATAAIEAVVAGRPEEIQRLIHPDATNREAAIEPPAARGTGPDAFLGSAEWLRAAFSDLAVEVHDSVASEDLVAIRVTISGRHTGDFVTYGADGRVERAFAPTGRTFAASQTHWQRVRDGQVVEHWADRDDLGQATQAGWIPPTPAYLFRCARATRRARRSHR